MCRNKEIRKVIKSAKKRGWKLHRKSKHEVYKHRNGGVVTVSTTTCNNTAWKKIQKDFRDNE